MKADQQYIYTIQLDLVEAAHGLRMTAERTKEILKDGRAVSRFAEDWVCEVYGLSPQPPNHKGSDAVGARDTNYSIKALTEHGTAARPSSSTGIKRVCTEEIVNNFIKENSVHIFVDNTALPEVRFIAVNSAVLMEWHMSGILGRKSGTISYKKFYKQESISSRETKTHKLRIS